MGTEKSTSTTVSLITRVPNRSACFLKRLIKSVPKIPEGNPGKFSTSVVMVNCPPACCPSNNIGCNSARAAYNAAVSPAGPEPIIMSFSFATQILFYMMFQTHTQCFFCHGTRKLVDHLTAFKNNESGNGKNIVTLSNLGRIIHVHFSDHHIFHLMS